MSNQSNSPLGGRAYPPCLEVTTKKGEKQVKVLKRAAVLTLIGNLIALAKTESLWMAAAVLLNSGLLVYLEWRIQKRRKED